MALTKNILKEDIILKKTIILFLVLTFTLSLASCSNANAKDNTSEVSITEGVTSNKTSESMLSHDEEMKKMIDWVENCIEHSQSNSFGGLDVSLYEDVALEVQDLFSASDTNAICVIEKLPTTNAGYFQISIFFDDFESVLEKAFERISENKYNSVIFVNGDFNLSDFLTKEHDELSYFRQKKITIISNTSDNFHQKAEIIFDNKYVFE